MLKPLKGFTPYHPDDVEVYNRLRYWPGLTFGDTLDRAADMFPDKTAFVDGRSRMTYGQVREKANRLAIGLIKLGIKPTNRVLVQLPNWNEFVVVFFALQKIGAIDTLLIDRYRAHEIKHLADLSGARYWILPETYKKTDYRPIIHEVLKGNRQIKDVLLVRGSGQTNYSGIEELIADNHLLPDDLKKLASRRPDPMQVAHMGPTGGTTGLPKLVPRTHNDLICASEFCARAWEMDTHDVTLLAGPVGHDLTFSKGFLGSLLTFGCSVFLDSTDTDEICRAIEREKVTTTVWVPTLARRLVDHPGLDNYDLSSLKKMHCGGGASLAGLIQDVQDRLGCRFFNGYGATEGQTAISRSNDDINSVKTTVGKPTCPYDRYKVVDKNGRRLPADTPGELLIKGPGVFTGYYKNTEENKKIFTENGYFKTGDVAKIDKKGRISLCGRIKEMINRGGESISATEIEKLISAYPEIEIVAVVAMPDPNLGEKACAYIQTSPGADIDFEKIISFLKNKGSSVLHLPERIEFIDEIPLTKTGKVNKRFLSEDIRRKLTLSFDL